MTPSDRAAAAHFKRVLVAVDRATPRSQTLVEAALGRVQGSIVVKEIEAALAGLRRRGFTASDAEVDRALEALYQAAQLGVLSSELRSAILSVLKIGLERVGPLNVEQLGLLLGVDLNWPTFRAAAVRWASQHAAARVVQITSGTRGRVRDYVVEHVLGEMPLPVMARRIADTVPLHSRFAGALEKYRIEVGLAVSEGRISPSRGRQLVSRYEQRLIKFRSNSIATTELVTAGSGSNDVIWGEAAEQAILDGADWVQEWIAILRDGRTCKFCHALHGQRRRIGQDFVDPIDGTTLPGPTRHVKCRCQKRLVPADSEPLRTPPFIEPKTGGTLKPKIT